MTFDLPSITLLLTAISSLQLGSFALNFLKLFLEFRNKTQASVIAEMDKNLKKALQSIQDLEKDNKELRADNQKLHNEMNILKEDNATLKGLLNSQENRDIAIKEYLKKK